MKKKLIFWVVFVGVVIILGVGSWVLLRSGILADQLSGVAQNNKINVYKFSELTGQKISASGIRVDIPKGESADFYIELDNPKNTRYNSLAVVKKDIYNGQTQFPQNKIDERVVYNWQQKQVNDFNKSTPVILNNVDELLVKTNKVNYLDKSITTTNLPNSFGYMSNDINRLDFSLASAPVKLYFKISSPPAAGVYSGRIQIYDQINKENIAQFNLIINASSKSLPQPSDYTFACYMNDRIVRTDAAVFVPSKVKDSYISEDLFKKRLVETKKMGCNSLVLRTSISSDNAKMINDAQSAGFSKGVKIDFRYINGANEIEYKTLSADQIDAISQFKSIIQQILSDRTITIPIGFYGIDEPNARNTDAQSLDNYKTQAANIKLLFSQVIASAPNNGYFGSFTSDVTTAMVSDTYNDLMADPNANLHTNAPILNYYYHCPTTIPGLTCRMSMGDTIAMYKNNPSSIPANAAYYFQATREQPLENRYLGGLGLVASQLKTDYLNVVYGYVQQSGSIPIFSEDKIKTNNKLNNDKQNMLMYPARDGLIPTVQSEAISDGILDIKYYLAYLEINKNWSKCALNSADEMKTLLSNVEGSQASKNPSTTLTVSDINTSPYGLPTKSVESLRFNLEKLFFSYQDKCSK